MNARDKKFWQQCQSRCPPCRGFARGCAGMSLDRVGAARCCEWCAAARRRWSATSTVSAQKFLTIGCAPLPVWEFSSACNSLKFAAGRVSPHRFWQKISHAAESSREIAVEQSRKPSGKFSAHQTVCYSVEAPSARCCLRRDKSPAELFRNPVFNQMITLAEFRIDDAVHIWAKPPERGSVDATSATP